MADNIIRGGYLEDRLRRQNIARVQAGLTHVVEVELRDALIKALILAYEETSRKLADDFTQFAKAMVSPAGASRLEALHRQVGERAQRAVLNSYAQRVTARRTPPSRSNQAYRTRPERLAGKLRTALADRRHVVPTELGLSFMDTEVLDQEAAHWYRLNFGVGARGGRTSQGSFSLLMNGVELAQLSLTTGPSRNPMFMPRGFFVNAEGKREKRDASRRGLDAFFLVGQVGGMGIRGATGTPNVILTKGIEARNYLDAGLRTLADELPRAWDNFFRDALAARSTTSREQLDKTMPKIPFSTRSRRGIPAPTRFLGGRPRF